MSTVGTKRSNATVDHDPAHRVVDHRPSIGARVLLGLVRVYQAARAGRTSPCRYDPSCSAYAATALARFGASRGAWLAAGRLARCHPWGRFGPDPVPDKPPSPRNPSGRSAAQLRSP